MRKFETAGLAFGWILQGTDGTYSELAGDDVIPLELDDDLLWRYERIIYGEDGHVDCDCHVRPFSSEHDGLGINPLDS